MNRLRSLLHSRRWLLRLGACLALAAGTAAADEQPAVPEDQLGVAQILDMEDVAGPQISPDGSRIVYTRRHVDQLADEWRSELWILDAADGSRHRFLARGADPRWSPDGARIVYAAEDKAGATQLFVRWMDAEGATSQITRVRHSPSDYRWSPDGRSIAFLMLVPEKEEWKIDLPPAPEGAEWTEPPRLITRTHYRQDRRGFFEQGFTHLFVVPADGGTARQLTAGAWNAGAHFSGMRFGGGISWTPDGREILFDGLRDEAPEKDGYRQNTIYAVDVASKAIRQVVTEKGDWRAPAVSPDGSRVAFVGFPYTLQSYKSTEVWVAPVAGGTPRKLSGELDRDVRELHWRADGAGVYFSAEDRGSENLHFAPLEGAPRQLTRGEQMLGLDSVSRTGVAAAVRTSYHEPADVVRVELADGATRRLTRVNDDVLAGKRLGEVEEIWYESTGGAPNGNVRIQGWIVKPPDFDPGAGDEAQSYPLILHVHGGPHAMYDVGFSLFYQNLAALGYVVLYTNPRGSSGYGTEFGNAIDNAYPSVDHDDLMAGVDALVARGYVDPDRLYVTGCSGGGVLSSWAIGQTDRFAAAAVRCPVTNWISFAGTADIVQWGYHRFDGYFWDNPDKWLEHSPLMHVGKVTTPTLLMTGELDLRTPMAQTEEYYAALKVLGVETAMLRFQGEYHGTTRKPSNFMRTVLYLADWFGRHRKGS